LTGWGRTEPKFGRYKRTHIKERGKKGKGGEGGSAKKVQVEARYGYRRIIKSLEKEGKKGRGFSPAAESSLGQNGPRIQPSGKRGEKEKRPLMDTSRKRMNKQTDTRNTSIKSRCPRKKG